MSTGLRILCIVGVLLGSLPGCNFRENRVHFGETDAARFNKLAREIEYPDAKNDCGSLAAGTPPPLSLADGSPEFWDLKLEEAIQLALTNSKVMQDLGGLVLRSPATVQTIHGPSITDTDPRFGVEAALSEFDAIFSYSARAEKNDRALNNVFFGGGTRLLQQDLVVLQAQIAKKTATGAEFAFRNNTEYDANNSPGNLFPSVWNTNLEAEFRQPLFQGAGVEFNRINGTTRIPGVANGVMIARVNTDISLAEFERAVRDLVSNVESAYWDLYFAYRDLDARVRARDAALNSWRQVQAAHLTGRRGGEADREAEAREQYFRFQEEVQNALTGRLLENTQVNNGSSGGTFRGNGGVRVAERRLRLLLCLPINDGRLMRPSEEPNLAKLVFEWEPLLQESLARRVELRRQKWVIKRREMELVAAKNFLLPQVDSVGLYRWRGFGRDLLNPERDFTGEFDNAWANLTQGDFQEWQLGLQVNVPLGARRAHAAVRNAQLLLARERAVLQDQELQVVHDLSNAVADVERAYEGAQTAYNRRVASRQQVAAVQASYDADKVPLFNLLDAQRRAADAEIHYFATLAEYALAVKNVHFEKGSLLDYNEIYLAEGPQPGKAYKDAALRQPKVRSFRMNYLMSKPPAVSQGPYPQQQLVPPGVQMGDPMPVEVIQPGKPATGPATPGNSAPRSTVPSQPSPTQPAPPRPVPAPPVPSNPRPTTPPPVPREEATTRALPPLRQPLSGPTFTAQPPAGPTLQEVAPLPAP